MSFFKSDIEICQDWLELIKENEEKIKREIKECIKKCIDNPGIERIEDVYHKENKDYPALTDNFDTRRLYKSRMVVLFKDGTVRNYEACSFTRNDYIEICFIPWMNSGDFEIGNYTGNMSRKEINSRIIKKFDIDRILENKKDEIRKEIESFLELERREEEDKRKTKEIEDEIIRKGL